MNILFIYCYQWEHTPILPVTHMLADGFHKLGHTIIESEIISCHHLEDISHSLFSTNLRTTFTKDIFNDNIDLVIVASYDAESINCKADLINQVMAYRRQHTTLFY